MNDEIMIIDTTYSHFIKKKTKLKLREVKWLFFLLGKKVLPSVYSHAASC